jgi:N-acetylneuraminate lyase
MLSRCTSRIVRFQSQWGDHPRGSMAGNWSMLSHRAKDLYKGNEHFKYEPMSGIIVAALTALNEDGSQLNLKGVNKYVNDLASQRVTGAFVTGSSGQSVSLTVKERKRVLEAWMETDAVKEGRIRVVAHVGCDSIIDTIELAKHAEKQGVHAVSAIPPNFFKPTGNQDVAEFIIRLAHEIPTTPVLYYHIPSMTGVNIYVSETLKMAKALAPNIVGAKFTDSNSADLSRCASYGFTTWLGGEDMFSFMLAAGTNGSIGITFNFAGDLYADLYAAFTRGDRVRADQLQKFSTEILGAIRQTGNLFGASYYTTERLRGLDFGNMRYPGHTLNLDQRAPLDKVIDENIAEYERLRSSWKKMGVY